MIYNMPGLGALYSLPDLHFRDWNNAAN